MTRADAPSHAGRSKDAVAARLAQSHYRVDPSITRIVRIVAPGREDDAAEPIKLLEVNAQTPANGIVPVGFGPHAASGVYYPSVIVEVRPEEFEQIQRGNLPLPGVWELGEEISQDGADGS